MPSARLTAARSEHQATFAASSWKITHTNSAEEPFFNCEDFPNSNVGDILPDSNRIWLFETPCTFRAAVILRPGFSLEGNQFDFFSAGVNCLWKLAA